jgi:nitrite reductase/ring-hydroxylating ferredoxin subunit
MDELLWHQVADLDELPEGRVKTVAAGHRSLALTHFDGRYAALENRCPHQGGPLGEGTIEKGMLRCPWHGYDYCPLTGLGVRRCRAVVRRRGPPGWRLGGRFSKRCRTSARSRT